MKKLSITITVTALIAFSLGYFARGPVERIPNISRDTENLTVRAKTEGPAMQSQAIAHTGQDDADAPPITSIDHESFITSTSSTPREVYVKNKNDILGDFFLINGIGRDRAEQITQDLVDADHHLAEKGTAMLDRHTAEQVELIAQGDFVEITYTTEERAELDALREKLHRQVFGEYYEAYESYRLSYPQRRVVKSFSSMLPEPLEYTTREIIVQIMYEEHSRFVPEQKSESVASGTRLTSNPLEQVDEKDEHLLAMRSFNDRVMDRTRAYLTPAQFEQFKKLFDDELRRYELLTELTEIDEPR